MNAVVACIIGVHLWDVAQMPPGLSPDANFSFVTDPVLGQVTQIVTAPRKDKNDVEEKSCGRTAYKKTDSFGGSFQIEVESKYLNNGFLPQSKIRMEFPIERILCDENGKYVSNIRKRVFVSSFQIPRRKDFDNSDVLILMGDVIDADEPQSEMTYTRNFFDTKWKYVPQKNFILEYKKHQCPLLPQYTNDDFMPLDREKINNGFISIEEAVQNEISWRVRSNRIICKAGEFDFAKAEYPIHCDLPPKK